MNLRWLYVFLVTVLGAYGYMWLVDPGGALKLLPLLVAPVIGALLAPLYVRWLTKRAEKNQKKEDE